MVGANFFENLPKYKLKVLERCYTSWQVKNVHWKEIYFTFSAMKYYYCTSEIDVVALLSTTNV